MFGFTKVLASAAESVAVVGGSAAATAGTDAAATGAAGAGAGGVIAMITSMLPMVLVIVLLYLIMIRPQRKKEKELKAQIDAMKVGDKIVTIGGICGKVARIKDDYVFIETGNIGTPDEKSVIKFERSAIKTVETIHG
ncbi:MAG: preprotein translocase subunit YajC [Eubacteriales bacterium]|nr:preprotein translocase subunit YajC [Eubacteriales bacterium]